MQLFKPSPKHTKAERERIADEISNNQKVRKFLAEEPSLREVQIAILIESERSSKRLAVLDPLVIRYCLLIKSNLLDRIYA